MLGFSGLEGFRVWWRHETNACMGRDRKIQAVYIDPVFKFGRDEANDLNPFRTQQQYMARQRIRCSAVTSTTVGSETSEFCQDRLL